MAVALAFVLIYLVLAALYESFILPLIIMITMPLAFGGASIGLLSQGIIFHFCTYCHHLTFWYGREKCYFTRRCS